ncbi:T9SS type A sorting domain-containing protein [Winogradskyella arenosi]|uniref:Putative secreted protein (Por secretion system target) n=1 Tax=Winogradskyella arenosi TaxID=533325 RepID=A0A368ZIP8_9FLAO|nr:T9SS type A sorting domain-containing protein [Winogradskyella arenosi]RCW91241.1 putative secreted protein (Por secretion system target) [Winogradskyella arenosi]
MKKITIYLMMLLSASSFAQIEIIDDFDNGTNNQSPEGWIGEIVTTSGFTCGDEGLSAFSYAPAGVTTTLTSNNYTGVSNGTDLTVSFSYNIFEQVSQFPPVTFTGPGANWGSLVLEYSTDGGLSWINLTTIDASNYIFIDSDTCQSTGTINAGTIADGSDFQVRFVNTVTNVSGFRQVLLIDNVSITQTSNAVPNCDFVLTTPVDGATGVDADVTLSWQAATGLPTGYTVSVGTTQGGTDIVNQATTSEASYTLSDLTYETLYYVNIVPFNAIGAATGCTEQSFTTRSAPLPGATCSNPIEITSFPFIEAGGNTDNYENNIDESPCSNSYMNGKDVFYSVTPTVDTSIDINLTNISNNGSSVHVLNGCPDSATECVDYEGSYSGTSRNLTDVVLLAGNTYFIVLSNSSASRTYTYDLIITANSCVNPTLGTLTPVADCDNGQFSIDVEVSYLGSATSLTLSDDVTTTADVANITATGIVTMGPYESGSTVNFTVTNNQDTTCLYTDSAYFYCPPSNDDCDAPLSLTVNTDGSCTILTSATNAGATESISDPNTCGSTTDNTNDVWFSFEATSEIIVLEYLDITAAIGGGGTIQATELLEGTCGALTSLNCYTSNYVTLTDLTIGNIYYVRNNTRLNGEYAQDFNICLRAAAEAPVNDECSGAIEFFVSTDDACNNQVTGSTVGATLSAGNACETEGYGDVWYVFNPEVSGLYEFSLDRLSTTPSSSFAIYEGACGTLIDITGGCSTANKILTLDQNLSYYVMVQTSQTGVGIDFNLCAWQLPDAVANNDCSSPVVLAESIDENGNNAISGNMENAYPSAENCSTTRETVWYSFTPNYTGTYNFEFTRVSGSASFSVFNGNDCSTIDNDIEGLTSCYLSGSRSGDFVAGTTYLISVHASSAAEFELFVYPDATLNVDLNTFEGFKFYPNPVVNTLSLEAKQAISSISVYNMIGQQVMQQAPNSLNASVQMNNLNEGVYFVKVTIDGAKQTFKVIKE